MNYFYYILNKLKLTSNIINYTSNISSINSGNIGRVKTAIKISNKNMKAYFIIYLVVVFLALFCPGLWFIFFPMSMSMLNRINDVENKQEININTPNIGLSIVIFFSIFILSIIYIFLKKHFESKNKEGKPTNINIYNRELPENLTPAHARLLVTDGDIDSKTLAATILDLIDRGYLKLEKGNREEIFTKDLLISKTNKTQEDLFEYEKYLINWFFNNEKTSSLELHKKLNDVKNNPCEDFYIFQGLLLISFPLDKYYNENNVNYNYKTYIAIFAISMMVYGFNIFIKSILVFAVSEAFALFGLINVLFKSPTYLFNQNGAEIRDSFLDLRRFLKDFSLIHERGSEEIMLWNYYLSYSIALSIEGEAYQEIDEFFGNNIYNMNNQKLTDEAEIKKLIDNIPNEIQISKQLYKKRKVYL